METSLTRTAHIDTPTGVSSSGEAISNRTILDDVYWLEAANHIRSLQTPAFPYQQHFLAFSPIRTRQSSKR